MYGYIVLSYDSKGTSDCDWKMKVYWIGIEIEPSNKPPKPAETFSFSIRGI